MISAPQALNQIFATRDWVRTYLILLAATVFLVTSPITFGYGQRLVRAVGRGEELPPIRLSPEELWALFIEGLWVMGTLFLFYIPLFVLTAFFMVGLVVAVDEELIALVSILFFTLIFLLLSFLAGCWLLPAVSLSRVEWPRPGLEYLRNLGSVTRRVPGYWKLVLTLLGVSLLGSLVSSVIPFLGGIIVQPFLVLLTFILIGQYYSQFCPERANLEPLPAEGERVSIGKGDPLEDPLVGPDPTRF